MTLDEFKQLWVDSGRSIEDLVLNYYVIQEEDGYVTGCYAVLEGNYDFYGQVSLWDDLFEGWYKFVRDESETGGNFVLDEAKKAEIIAKREEEAKKPTDQDRLEAQTMYTALMTDTLLPEEEA